MGQRNTSDLISSTPQWASYCANEKGRKKIQLPDFVVDKREIVVDPVSKKRFYKCKMICESAIYHEIKNMIQ